MRAKAMSVANLPESSNPSNSTPIHQKLLNILVSPGEVFEEVISAPTSIANWLVPTLLVCIAGIILLKAATTNEAASYAVEQMIEARGLAAAHEEKLPGGPEVIAWLAIGLGAFAGTFWSAFVLWFIGRVFLRTRYSFLKAAEVVGLTGIILVLGSVVTALLIGASDNPTARPALSLFASELDSNSPIRAVLDTMNLFHLWTTTVLAVGLSKLSGVSFKESVFWVFGYWLAARVALILLG